MEPELPEPIRESGATLPEQSNLAPRIENAPNTRSEGTHETLPTPLGSSTPTPVAPVPIANPPSAPVNPVATGVDHTGSTSAGPLIADDVDVIEKEWVDKAKKIVSATKEDPHAQEKEVSKLQADYLMKRYNKKLKAAE